mgnify:CR=1 FL=1
MRKHGSSDRVTLEKSEIERDLGVQVDKDLRFSQHIETQVNKANRLLGLIRSYEYFHAESMQLLFVALVRPHLEFGNVVWSPRLEKDKKLVEGVQRRATKIIPGLKDLTYEQRLEKMKLPSMCYRRLRGDLIEVFKYTHNIYKLSDSLLELESRTNTRGHTYNLKK